MMRAAAAVTRQLRTIVHAAATRFSRLHEKKKTRRGWRGGELRTFVRANCAAVQGRYRWRGARDSGSRIGRLAACGTRVAQASAEQAQQAGGMHLAAAFEPPPTAAAALQAPAQQVEVWAPRGWAAAVRDDERGLRVGGRKFAAAWSWLQGRARLCCLRKSQNIEFWDYL